MTTEVSSVLIVMTKSIGEERELAVIEVVSAAESSLSTS